MIAHGCGVWISHLEAGGDEWHCALVVLQGRNDVDMMMMMMMLI